MRVAGCERKLKFGDRVGVSRRGIDGTKAVVARPTVVLLVGQLLLLTH